jgi:sulfoxide reductase heme-binding subunit YedZ
MNTLWQIRFVWKPLLFLACVYPFAHVVADLYGIGGTLGTNPIEEIQDRLGIWGLRFIMIALAVTPLRQLTGRNWMSRFRRMLGLYAFFYVCMHFLTWLVLDQEMLWSAIVEDIVERPFITIGFAALLILLALAATSPQAARRRLGRTWQKLHNWVYVAAVFGVWHYWWQVKQDVSEPLLYAAILAVLMGYRAWYRWLRPSPGKR